MEREQQRRIVEALILASPEPIVAARIAALLPRCNPSHVRGLVKELNDEYAQQRRAFEIWEVAGGYQLRSLPEFAPYIKQIQETRSLRLSNAGTETACPRTRRSARSGVTSRSSTRGNRPVPSGMSGCTVMPPKSSIATRYPSLSRFHTPPISA